MPLRRALARLGSPGDVLAASAIELEPLLGASGAAALKRGPDPQALSAALAWLDHSAHRLITLADSKYPRLLLETPDPPVLLYAHGRVDLLRRPALAIVGTRNPTRRGTQDAEAFACSLSDAGLTVVSGLALGIDAAAHRGGLAGAASTIAVVGTGLDRVYPARNRDLAHAIAERGVLVSEFPLGAPPVPANFPRRNRIISGLALGCLVVEAALQSGSLITARQALEQGREVFAIPGSIHSPLAKGCHWLIKQGAKLVESAQDVLEELGLGKTAPAPAQSTHATPADAAILLDAVAFAPFDLDEACAASGLTPAAASAILLTLELDGRVERLPGGLYQRTR